MQSLKLIRHPEEFGYPAHAHFWRRALSRRSFVGAAAGLLASPSFAAFDEASPKPIPGGIQPLGPGTEVFHLFLPGPGAEPSTITDFNGQVGVAVVRGAWEKTSGPGPQPTPPLFYEADMRFMTGVYVGTDERRHEGTFAFIWIDLFEGPGAPDFVNFSNQVHDFNPGITPNGVFWTIAVRRSSVTVHPGSGVASLVVNEVAVRDFFNLPNALMRGKSNPATVSFDVRWERGRKKVKIRDEVNQFAGQFVENTARMSWSARTADSNYLSITGEINPFAVVGHERNGVFFPEEED